MNFRRLYIKFVGILALSLFAAAVVFPDALIKMGDKLNSGQLKETGAYFQTKFPYRLGLDLQGGAHLVFEIKNENLSPEDKPRAVESLRAVMRKRVDQFGVAEPNLYTTRRGGKDFMVVELPGIQDLTKALDLIGKTAKLEFKVELKIPEEFGTPEQAQGPQFTSFEPPLTGEHLRSAAVVFDPNSGLPQVSLEFDEEGTKIFSEMTKQNIGKSIAIYLDEELISAPRVNNQIADGHAVITGVGKVEDARAIAIQLNAGALPVPVELAENRSVGATLGSQSIKLSILAGLIGLLAVLVFMVIYYRLPGVLAGFALVIYSLITLMLFKGVLSFILPFTPVTLTLAGIAGFVLSVGMAVDANILIFERIKEELRAGKETSLAISTGFARAWNSIRDSNVSSLITCLILFIFGTGIIRGFAVTLALGIFVSMFTAINVTRTFLALTTKFKFMRRLM